MEELGRIVLLNGPSSSGKSSIGHAMLALLDKPWFLVPVDAVNGMRSTVYRHELDQADLDEVLRRTRRGYHRAVAALASTGNHVIMDYPLSEPWRVADLVEVLDEYVVTWVDVHCSPVELARRERARGDRPVGLAAAQRVYEHGEPDIAVDTTHSTPHDCAAIIVSQMNALSRPTAFDRLRQGSQ